MPTQVELDLLSQQLRDNYGITIEEPNVYEVIASADELTLEGLNAARIDLLEASINEAAAAAAAHDAYVASDEYQQALAAETARREAAGIGAVEFTTPGFEPEGTK